MSLVFVVLVLLCAVLYISLKKKQLIEGRLVGHSFVARMHLIFHVTPRSV